MIKVSKKAVYQTKQRNKIQDFLLQTKGKHFTVAEVCQYFKKHNISMAMATVYRRLEELLNKGKIKKFFIDEKSSACFEYIGDLNGTKNSDFYHMKCKKCGKLRHLECKDITLFEKHITKHHKFHIDPHRTIFYGLCKECKN